MAEPVLLVHDDIATIASVRRLLTREGHEVILATSVADALIAFGHHLPALIVLAPGVESGRGPLVLEELGLHPDMRLARVLLLGEAVAGSAAPVAPLPLDGAHFVEQVKTLIQAPPGPEGWYVVKDDEPELPPEPAPSPPRAGPPGLVPRQPAPARAPSVAVSALESVAGLDADDLFAQVEPAEAPLSLLPPEVFAPPAEPLAPDPVDLEPEAEAESLFGQTEQAVGSGRLIPTITAVSRVEMGPVLTPVLTPEPVRPLPSLPPVKSIRPETVDVEEKARAEAERLAQLEIDSAQAREREGLEASDDFSPAELAARPGPQLGDEGFFDLENTPAMPSAALPLEADVPEGSDLEPVPQDAPLPTEGEAPEPWEELQQESVGAAWFDSEPESAPAPVPLVEFAPPPVPEAPGRPVEDALSAEDALAVMEVRLMRIERRLTQVTAERDAAVKRQQEAEQSRAESEAIAEELHYSLQKHAEILADRETAFLSEREREAAGRGALERQLELAREGARDAGGLQRRADELRSQAEEEARRRLEAERSAASEAEARVQAEARLEEERTARAEAEARAEARQAERTEAVARAESEQSTRAEAEAQVAAERAARAEAEAQVEAERAARAEAEAQVEAERAARQEAEARTGAERAALAETRSEEARAARATLEARTETERAARLQSEAQARTERTRLEAQLEAERTARAEVEAQLEAERAERTEAQARLDTERAELEAQLEAERAERTEAQARLDTERAELEAQLEAERTESRARLDVERTERAALEAQLEAERAERTEEQTRLDAERKARVEVEAQLEAELAERTEEQTRLDAERVTRAELETQLEAERTARAELEAQLEAERAERAEAQARLEAETKAHEEWEARAHAEVKARKDVAARLEKETRARMEAEARATAAEQARAEADTRAQAEKKSRLEVESRARTTADARVQSEMSARAEAEARAEAAEAARAEAAALADKEGRARARAELGTEVAEKARARAEARATKAEQERNEARSQSEEHLRTREEVEMREVALSRRQQEWESRLEGAERARAEAESHAEELERARVDAETRAVTAERLRVEMELRVDRAEKARAAAQTRAADEKQARSDAEARAEAAERARDEAVDRVEAGLHARESWARETAEQAERLAHLESSLAERQAQLDEARSEAERLASALAGEQEARALLAQSQLEGQARLSRLQAEAEAAEARARAALITFEQPGGATVDIARAGNVDARGLAGLLARLQASRLQARFELKGAGALRVLWLKDGRLVGALSSAPEESLVERARADALIDARQENELRLVRSASTAALLDTMRTRGHLLEKEVVPLVQRYTEQVALDAFGEPSSLYRLVEEPPPHEVALAASTRPLLHLLSEALRDHASAESFLATAGGLRAGVFRAETSPGVDAFGLSSRELRLLDEVDGEQTLEQILLGAGLPQDTALKLLSLLSTLGLLVVRPAVAVAGQEAPGDIEVRRLESKFEEIQDADYFSVLGLARTAGSEDVKRAHALLSAEFHPLRFAGHPDPVLQHRAQQISNTLSEAARALGDDRLREEYARSLLD